MRGDTPTKAVVPSLGFQALTSREGMPRELGVGTERLWRESNPIACLGSDQGTSVALPEVTGLIRDFYGYSGRGPWSTLQIRSLRVRRSC